MVRLGTHRWVGLCAVVGVLAVAGTTCATMSAHDVSRTFPARQYTLPSGLRVVIDEDPSASLVGVAWVVDVGGVDDPEHHGELAHAVEHLVFELPDAAAVAAH